MASYEELFFTDIMSHIATCGEPEIHPTKLIEGDLTVKLVKNS